MKRILTLIIALLCATTAHAAPPANQQIWIEQSNGTLYIKKFFVPTGNAGKVIGFPDGGDGTLNVMDVTTPSELTTALSSYLTTAAAASGYQPLDADLTSIAALTTTVFGRSLLDDSTANTAWDTLELADWLETQTYLNIPGLTAALAGYQPLDADLTSIAALTTTSFGRGLLDDADAAASRSTLGLGTMATETAASYLTTAAAATAYQPLDSDLTSIAALTTTSHGRGLLDDADAAASRSTLGLGTMATETAASYLTTAAAATAYQPLDSDLTSIAALTTTSFGRGLLDDADAPAARTSLGLVIGTNVQAFDADLSDLADGSLDGSKVGSGISASNITTGTLDPLRFGAVVDFATQPLVITQDIEPNAAGRIAYMTAIWDTSGHAIQYYDSNKFTVKSIIAVSDTAPEDGEVPTWDEAAGEFILAPGGGGGGSGDITKVGDVSSGAAFDGSAGTTLTFDDPDGDKTFLYHTTDNVFRVNAALEVPAEAYDTSGWNGDAGAPQKDAVRDELELRQPLDADLTSIAALTTTSFGRGLLDDADAAAARTSIGAVIGTDVQAADSDLTSIAALTTTSFGRGLLDDADAAAARTSIGAVIGTDVQAFDADLSDLADGSLSGSKVGSGISGTNVTSGTVPVANGGTGQTTYTDGQILIGNTTGNTLAKATITAGTGISVTNGNGSITIAATGGGGSADAYLAKTTTYTAVAGERIAASTSGGAWTLTLPASPSGGDTVWIADAAGTFDTANLTVARNSQNINGAAADLTLRTEFMRCQLIFVASDGWRSFDSRRGVDVQAFTSSGTWYKPAGATHVEIIAVGAGGGGGSGRKGAAGGARFGGGGGSGGDSAIVKFAASSLSSTETVTVGAAGAGGAAQTTNTNNGNPGSPGGDSTFGAKLTVRGGNFGGGGSNSAGAAGSARNYLNMMVTGAGVGGAAATATTGAQPGAAVALFPTGGGSGGSLDSSDTARAGGAGGIHQASTIGIFLATAAGGTAGTTSGTSGGNGNASDYWVGTGGGGGGVSASGAAAGAGGNGGGFGSGGGGGAAGQDGAANSGAGGNGAAGIIIVTTFCQ